MQNITGISIYHAPYISSREVKRPVKVYIQRINSVRGAPMPQSHADGMGELVVWFNETAFDSALESINRQMAGKVSFEKGEKVMQGGFTVWQIHTWSPRINAYVADERTGSYLTKEAALEQCRGDYMLHRSYLSIASKKNLDKIGLPEPEFVDFTKPNEYREFI